MSDLRMWGIGEMPLEVMFLPAVTARETQLTQVVMVFLPTEL